MAKTAFKGTPVTLAGEFVKAGTSAPEFTLVKGDLSNYTLKDGKGKYLILNIFPSMDTGVCATSVRKFNQLAANQPNTVVLAISKDLPFAQGRFCTTEGITNVIPLSDYRYTSDFAEKYGVLGYLEADNFVNVKYHQEFLKDVHEEIRRNSKAPFVKNFRMNYAGGMLPIYALVEVFSFGTLSKFYKNMKNPDKKAIAKSFGIGYTYLESWLESISYVRNICAHYGRLYNAKLSKTPMLYKEYSEAGIGNNRIFGVLLCLKHILKNDNHWNMFVDKIEILFDKYENVDITTMGFKENWKALLENDK